MVFDRYFEFSTKSVTRTKWSGDQGTRYRVVGNTPLPGNWTTFLKSVENKRELNEFLAKSIVETVLVGAGKYLLQLAMKTYWWYPMGILMWTLCTMQPCNQEDADARIFLHVVHASSHRSTRVTIKSNDSDIVILETALFPQLDLKELYVTFGRDKSYQVSQAMFVLAVIQGNY